jgi:tetratricopeptide (TPR) repeat protein
MLLDDLKEITAKARIIIATRESSEPDSCAKITIPALNKAEIDEILHSLPSVIRDRVISITTSLNEVYPLDVRRAVAAIITPQQSIFDVVAATNLQPRTKELLALIALSPEPLALDELGQLSPSEDENLVSIDERLASISYLVVDDGLGFRPVHDEIANDLRASLSRRPGLLKFVSLRLARFFAKTKRYMAAFELYQRFDQEKTLRTAHKAASQAAVEGRFGHSVRPLEFIAEAKRASGERLNLAIALLSLAQAYDSVGNTASSNIILSEAATIATQIDDQTLLQLIQDQQLIGRVRRQLRRADLATLREVRARYKAEGRLADSARLAIEEGAILISIGDHDTSIPILREARTIFLEIKDNYGVYIATRNLIASLNMVEGDQNEAERLLQSIHGQSEGLGRLRERAWMCNILTRRYRIDGLLDRAVAAAREAIEIGGKLGDPYVVALNRIGLGNALREKGELTGALEAFKQCGREAQVLKRNEMDGLASRLAAEVLVQMASAAAPYQRPALFGEAEAFATHVIGLLSESIVRDQVALALDARADARMGLGRKEEAFLDYAAAAKAFTELGEDQAVPIIRRLAANLEYARERSIETMRVLSSTLPTPISGSEADNPWQLLIDFIRGIMMYAHRRGVGILIGAAFRIAQGIVSPQVEFGLWLRLLSLALDGIRPLDDGRLSFALSAFLAHARQRQLSPTQLSAVTDVTLGHSEKIHFHSLSTGELQTSLSLGRNDKLLLVLDDVDSNSATRFVTISVASFFTGYRAEIDQEFLPALENGTFVRCCILDMEHAPADIRERFVQVAAEAPVVVAQIEADSGRPHELIIACRPDVQQQCHGDPLRATELQFMYADVLRAVLRAALGGQIESDILRPKIISLLRSTIH